LHKRLYFFTSSYCYPFTYKKNEKNLGTINWYQHVPCSHFWKILEHYTIKNNGQGNNNNKNHKI
jgi:hypothetical protein